MARRLPDAYHLERILLGRRLFLNDPYVMPWIAPVTWRRLRTGWVWPETGG